MKYLCSLFISGFVLCPCFAYELDLNVGSITHHIIVRDGVESEFEGGIAFNNRMIFNKVYSLGLTIPFASDRYHTYRLFGGENSIHKPMLGVSFESGKQRYYMDYGIIVGGYVQNNRLYHERGIDNLAIEFDDAGIIPIVGVTLHLKYPLTDRIAIGFSNIITPALTNHSILLRYDIDY